jgi:hypothetical protein
MCVIMLLDVSAYYYIYVSSYTCTCMQRSATSLSPCLILYMCPHTTIYICVLIQLYLHAAQRHKPVALPDLLYVSSYYYVYASSYYSSYYIYVSSYTCTCMQRSATSLSPCLILYMCPHTTKYMCPHTPVPACSAAPRVCRPA